VAKYVESMLEGYADRLAGPGSEVETRSGD
jgi:hypothetical protein